MTLFLPIAAAALWKSALNALPLVGGIAAGLLAGFFLSRRIERKKKQRKQGRR